MNLLIFLDLTYNPWRNLKFCSLQGKNANFFLFLPITGVHFFDFIYYTEGHIYTLSAMGVQPPPIVTTMSDLPSLLRKIYRLHSCRFDHIKYKSRNGILVEKIYRINPDRWTPSSQRRTQKPKRTSPIRT